ncbi:hypothetical protein I8J29_33025 [Paenibacillus sp. MWE-103]|uniref:Uncharacterized protein n=1 Tax=Paenibacillus artemisiicola TaxID=1172618 RepID=A0ABS3WKZ1_9BACL|nr:hypothetical protein [Paenibacillus artemisiicola]MBO7748996.1 hypothetical protein [Paenibacillus artemisiicola]
MEWLTVAQVSEQVDIPAETVRRYITRHGLHLQVKKGHKSYQIAESCLPVFRQIRALYDEGKQVDEVEAALVKSGRPTVITVNEAGESMTVNVAESLAAMDSKLNAIAVMLMNANERLNSGEQDRAAMREEMQGIREQVMNVHQEIAATNEQLTGQIVNETAGIREHTKSENDRLRQELAEARWEANSSTKQITEQLENAVQQNATVAAVANREERGRRLDEHFTQERIKRQLRSEAIEAWNVLPEAQRTRKVGLFRREEDTAARDRFVRDYVDERYEARMREEFE